MQVNKLTSLFLSFMNIFQSCLDAASIRCRTPHDDEIVNAYVRRIRSNN